MNKKDKIKTVLFGITKILWLSIFRAFLIFLFFLIVTPIGLFKRFILKKDSMHLKDFKNSNLKSVFKNREHIFVSSDIENPF